MLIGIFLNRLGDHLRESYQGGLVPPVKHPAPSLLGDHEAGTPQEVHVMRNRRLREADCLLDVAGAQPALFPRDEVAAGLPASAQQLENLQTRRVSERLEDGYELFGPPHISITIDVSIFGVKCVKTAGRPRLRSGDCRLAESLTAQ